MDRRALFPVRTTSENTLHVSAVLLEDWLVISKANTVRFDDLGTTVLATGQGCWIRR